MSQARLIVVAGLTGSGETTLAHQLEQTYAAVRLSADDWMESLGINLHGEQESPALDIGIDLWRRLLCRVLLGPILERMDR